MKTTSTDFRSISKAVSVFVLSLAVLFSIGTTASAQQADVNIFDSLDREGIFRAPVVQSSLSSATDDQWISQWSTPGLDLYGVDMVEVGGDIYIGGVFFSAGGVLAASIIKYDPDADEWSPLGSGLTNSGGLAVAFDLEVSGDNIYVGGQFSEAGGVPANNIAIYNTVSETWSALGSGVDNVVSAIEINGSNVFVGGRFTNAGAVPASYVALWNGTSWSALGSGTNDEILALATYNNELYAGGYFSQADGATATRIARWNGTAWNPVSNGVDQGVNSTVRALQVVGNDLYIGGAFSSAAGVTGFNHIARWNATSSTFSQVGTGFDDDVTSLENDNGTLRATGLFENSGINSVNFVAEFDGTVWTDLNGGVWGHPSSGVGAWRTLTVGDDTYVTGYFTGAGASTPVAGIAIYDNSTSTWRGVGPGNGNALAGTDAIPIVQALGVSGDNLFVGGTGLEYAGNVHIQGIGMWDESSNTWSDLGGVTDGSGTGFVHAVAISGDLVYVAGRFDTAGGVAAENIAVYNIGTATWSALGAGVSSNVYDLLINGSSVYATGSFTSAGGNPANRIAVWNGSTWSPLGTGLSSTGNALALYNNEIYVGGSFSTAGGVTASNIAKWNGVSWSALFDGVAEGTDNTVNSLEVAGDSILYLGGFFTDAGSVTGVNRIASWKNSTTTFDNLGTGFNHEVLALLAGPDGQLYAGGPFTASGLADINGIATWNGSTWSGLGSGVNLLEIGGGPTTMVSSANGNDMYVGGAFSLAGQKPSNAVARYNFAPTTSVDDVTPDNASTLVAKNYPNPFIDITTIDVQMETAGRVSIKVYDILGRQVMTVADSTPANSGSNLYQVDGSDLKSGVYFYRVDSEGRSATGLMTLVK